MAPKQIIGDASRHGLTQNAGGIDWLSTAVNGGSLLLTIVSDASKLAPIPFLQQAAGTTVKIAQAVQAVKDNKMAFRRIAYQSMELVAAIYQAYERSSNKAQWPPKEINVVIEELLITLQSIYELVEKQLSRGKYKRFLSSATDLQLISEFRERLQASVNKFEISSHLSIHDTLTFVVKSQIDAQQQRERERMALAEQERLNFHAQRLEEETRFREREEARRAQQAADDMLRHQAEERERREREERESGEAHDAIMRIHYVTDIQLDERERVQAEENEAREREIRERELERQRLAMEDEERLARLQEQEREKAELVSRLREEAAAEKRRMETEMREVLDRERKEREELERGAVLEITRLREELEKAKTESRKGKKRDDDAGRVGVSLGATGPQHGVSVSGQSSVLMSAALGKYSVQVKQKNKKPVSTKARVETEDEDDNDDSEQTISDEEESPYSESESSEEEAPPPPPPPPPPPKKKKKSAVAKPAQAQAESPLQDLRQQLLALGIDLASLQTRDSGTSINAGAGAVDALGAAYAHLSVNSNAAQLIPPPPPPPTHFYAPQPQSPPVQSPHPPHTYSPPPPPGMYPQYYGPPGAYVSSVGYLTPANYYGAPNGYANGHGNITSTTISNVGNNYSVSTVYGSPQKKKKKAERV